ncbi:MAG: hypothetical protein WCJ11_07165 [Methylococcaceae bacterium]
MLNKKETFAALQVLKQGRAEMVQDFLDHKPEIYEPSFKYEGSPVLLKFAREKYFITWLSSHWQLFIHESTFFTDKQEETEVIFARVFLELLGKWSILKTSDSSQLNLGMGIRLIENMQNTLNEFINVGDNSDAMRNKVKVEIAKNRVLIDREIKQLSEMKL